MGIFLWDTAPSKIFIGSSEVASVWAWDTKIRPTNRILDFLLVWWWGAWWLSWGWLWWGWGGAWGIIYCEWEIIETWNYMIHIWEWGCWLDLWWNKQGGDSSFNNYIAYWGWGGWYGCASGTWGSCPVWCNWASWWWGSRCGSWGIGTQWCNWGDWLITANSAGWGGGWYTTTWCVATRTGSTLLYCQNWGDWWLWYSSSITWQTEYYAYWWGWGAWNSRWAYGIGSCWGWNWGDWTNCPRNASWCSATTYGSWWGWAWWRCICCGGKVCGGNGCQWVFIARYPSNCNYNITWGTKYECNWYCIHCFTSDWTLTVS